MTNTQIFFENLVNERHTVLGLELKPFCILHYLWLQHIGSPLHLTSNALRIEDLELAALVCSSSSSEEILERLSPRSRWARFRRNRWHRRNRRLDLASAARAFLRYQGDYLSLPEFVPSDGQNIDEKMPWLLNYATALIKNTGWEFEKVITLPIGQVIWLNLSLGYVTSGKSSILSDKERAIMEILRSASDSLTGGNESI